jgi:hypothetical protein
MLDLLEAQDVNRLATRGEFVCGARQHAIVWDQEA